MFDVITFGSATRDVFLRSQALELHEEHGVMEACFVFGSKLNVEDIVIETGGGATNNAVTFSRLAKLRTAAVCRVGDDSIGDEIIEALREDHIATDFVQFDPKEKTAYSTILLSGIAERTILTHRGAASRLDPEAIPWGKIRAKLFFVSSLGGNLQLLEHIIRHAKRTGALIYHNPGNKEFQHGLKKLSPIFSRLDLLLVNRDEAATLTGLPADNLNKLFVGLRKICKHSILTDGSSGAYSITTSGVIHSSIVHAKRTNLTGAGDAFGSGFACGMLKYGDEKSALRVGTLNAGGVVQKMGAKVGILKGYPTENEMRRIKIKQVS